MSLIETGRGKEVVDMLAEKRFPKLPPKPHREVATEVAIFIASRTNEQLASDVVDFDDSCIDTPLGLAIISSFAPLGSTVADIRSESQPNDNGWLQKKDFSGLRSAFASRKTWLDLAEIFPDTARDAENFWNIKNIDDAGKLAAEATLKLYEESTN